MTVAVSSGTGSTLKVTSLRTASVPQLPERPRHRSTPGDVLHHAAAGLEDLAAAVDGAHAQQMVARRAGADAARAGDVGGEHAADRALAGLAADQRPELDGLERQHLAAVGEIGLDLAAAACRRAPTSPSRSARTG